MIFYIQTDIVGIDTKPLVKAVTNLGHEAKTFSRKTSRILEDDSFTTDREFIYGSIDTVNYMRDFIGNIFCGPELNFSKLYKASQKSYESKHCLFQKEVQFSPFDCIDSDQFCIGFQRFVRPNSCMKPFPGTKEYTHRLGEIKKNYRIDDDCLCVVAKGQEIKAEYRTLVCNKKIVAWSQYNEKEGYGKSWVESNYFPYSQRLLDQLDYWPFPAFIADFAVSYGHYGILELNSVNCAGLYDIDPEIFVREIASVCQ